MTFARKALLAELRVSRWGATKSDRKASNEFAASKNSDPTMSRVTKTLIQSPHLTGFDQLANQARGVHYNYTMPWLDNGLRILPAKKFIEYGKEIKVIADRSDACISDFCNSYDDLINTARTQLGELFNQTDYPSVEAVRAKFGISMRFLPVPQENDWRVDLSKDDISRLTNELKDTFAESQNGAVEDLTNKVKLRLEKLLEILSEGDEGSFKRRLRENHITGLLELPEFIDTMNVFDNEKLSKLATDIQLNFNYNFDADGLKTDSVLKGKVLESVKGLLASL